MHAALRAGSAHRLVDQGAPHPLVDCARYQTGTVNSGGVIFTIIGFLVLTLGGWLGCSIVFVHGMRVLSLVDEPAERAAAPIPKGRGLAPSSSALRIFP